MDYCIDAFFDCVRDVPGVDIGRPDKSRTHAYISTAARAAVLGGRSGIEGRAIGILDHSALADVWRFLETL